MTAFIDLTGQTFGRLTVISRAENDKRGQSKWNCRCSCSKRTELVVLGNSMRTGNTRSCGCVRNEMSGARTRTHGGRKTAIYNVWQHMLRRCRDPRNKAWKHYGSRGIAVCDRWLSFENFRADMGERPPGMSLERIDNDGPYSPENCIWADATIQARNRRNTRFIIINGEPRAFATACEDYGLQYHVMKSRWDKRKTLPTQADFEQTKQKLRPEPRELTR